MLDVAGSIQQTKKQPQVFSVSILGTADLVPQACSFLNLSIGFVAVCVSR